MLDIQFSQKSVCSALLSLIVHKSSKPDGIPPIALKVCAPELDPVLTRLFRLSYSVGVGCANPTENSFSAPDPKKGDRSDPHN